MWNHQKPSKLQSGPNYSEKKSYAKCLRLSWLMYIEKLTLRNSSTVLTMMEVPDGHLNIYQVLNCSMT